MSLQATFDNWQRVALEQHKPTTGYTRRELAILKLRRELIVSLVAIAGGAKLPEVFGELTGLHLFLPGVTSAWTVQGLMVGEHRLQVYMLLEVLVNCMEHMDDSGKAVFKRTMEHCVQELDRNVQSPEVEMFAWM